MTARIASWSRMIEQKSGSVNSWRPRDRTGSHEKVVRMMNCCWLLSKTEWAMFRSSS